MAVGRVVFWFSPKSLNAKMWSHFFVGNIVQTRILIWSITAALAGFLFGFDTVVISGFVFDRSPWPPVVIADWLHRVAWCLRWSIFDQC